jgi:hydrogenase maturation factor
VGRPEVCRTSVGVVIAVEDGEAVVDLDGLRRRAMSLMVPDLRPGDVVLVGLGTVLGRVEPRDRAALDRINRTDLAPGVRLPTPTHDPTTI